MAQLKETTILNNLKILKESDNDFLYMDSITSEDSNLAKIGYSLNGEKKDFILIDSSGNGACELANKAKALNTNVKFEVGDSSPLTTDFSNGISINLAAYFPKLTDFNSIKNTVINIDSIIPSIKKDITEIQNGINSLQTFTKTANNRFDSLIASQTKFNNLLNGKQPINSPVWGSGIPIISSSSKSKCRVSGLFVSEKGKITIQSESLTCWRGIDTKIRMIGYKGKKHKTFTFSSSKDSSTIKQYNKYTGKTIKTATPIINTGLVKATSDIRLKINIKDSKVNGLDLIDKIQLREFDWIAGEHQSIGFVADELELLDKTLVNGGGYDEDGAINLKSIEILNLQAYEVKAIQELSNENKKLKQQILNLENRLSKLEK